MMSPEYFKEQNKDKPLEELVKVRNKLVEKLNEYEEENILNAPQHKFIEIIINPSPEVRYSCYNEYLKEITDLIIEKQQKSNNFLEKDIAIEVRHTNWGMIAPNDWTDQIWKIYTDLTVDIENSYNRTENKVEKNHTKLKLEQYNEILKNISQAKIEDTKVEALDGAAWEIIQYEKGHEVWKRDLGYIYGIKSLENIAKILANILKGENKMSLSDKFKNNKYNSNPMDNVPRFVYGVPDVTKYNVETDNNATVEENSTSSLSKGDKKTSANMLEKAIIECAGPDPFWSELIRKYFSEEVKYDENTAVELLRSVAKDKEVFNEFLKYLTNKSYNINNAIKVDGISAKDLAEKNPKKTAIEIYSIMCKFKNR